jgi:colanic acid biosynthesis glycosyl transferase WcaI
VTLGHGMKARLQQKANCDPIVIATWADGQTIRPRVEAHADLDTEFARSAGIHADELVVMYSGNMGMAHDFAALIGLWRTERPEGQRPLHFVMVGDGAQKPALEAAAELARSRGWRITFLPYQPREALGQSLPTADVHLIVLDERAQDLVFPSKLHGVLAAGRPTLLLGPPASELARILRDGECGIAVRSDDVPGLADALAGWSDDPAPLQGMGERARTLFDSHYDRQVCCDQFTRVVDGLSRSAPL